MKKILLVCLLLISTLGISQDYIDYHKQISDGQEQIGHGKFQSALQSYKNVIDNYEFVFKKEYQVATQLAWKAGDKDLAFEYLRIAIRKGWDLKDVKRLKFLSNMQEYQDWKKLEIENHVLEMEYNHYQNKELKKEIREMYKEDQSRAFKTAFAFGSDAQDRYAESKYAPESERRLDRLSKIIDKYGYPGERLIGENLWVWTMLNHHNSISRKYNSMDKRYPELRIKLIESIKKGELSPYEFAIIEDWWISVKSGHRERSYGFINDLRRQDVPRSNKLREELGMRSIEVRNKLIDIEKQTGMEFFLMGDPWVSGKIKIK